jgi:hypothetical protein
MPFAKPESVSILAYPYGKFKLGGHLLITAAVRPTAKPRQSNNIWIESVRSPKDPVTKP